MNLSLHRRRQLKIAAVVLLALVIVYGGLGFFGVPWFAKRTLSNYVADSLQRELTIQKISFNPFTLVLNARGIALLEQNKDSIANLDHLHINVDLDEIFRKNLVVSSLLVENPRLELVIDNQGKLNITKLLDDLPEEKTNEAEDSSFGLVFESSQVTQGQIDVIDNSKKQPVSAGIKDINLKFSSISTIEREQGQYRISLNLDRETEMKLEGTLSLVPFASSGQFQIEELSVANAAKWLGEALPVTSLAGVAGVQGNYKLGTDRDGKAVVNIESARFDLANFSARDRYSDIVVSVQALSVKEARYSGAGRRVGIGELAVSALGLKSKPSEQIVSVGSLNIKGLGYDLDAGLLEASSAGLDALQAFRRTDQETLFKLDRLDLEAIGYSTTGGSFSAGSIDLSGSKVVLETAADGRLKLPDLPARNPPVPQSVNAGVETGSGIRLKFGALRLADTAVAYGSGEKPGSAVEVLALDKLAAENVDIDLEKQRIGIQALALGDANIELTIDQAGNLEVAGLFAKENAQRTNDKDTPESSPFGYNLGKLTVSGVDIVVTDKTLADPAQHRFAGLGLSANNLSNAADARTDLTLNVEMPKRGAMSLKGWIELATVRTEIQLALKDVDLAVLGPYLAAKTNLDLASGILGLSGQLIHLPNEAGFSLANGHATVSDIRLDERNSQQKLIAAESIVVDGAELAFNPTDIRLELIRLVGPYANFFIDEQQNLNLLQAIEGPTSATETSSSKDKEAQTTGPGFQLAVKRIDLENGNMDFADQSMTPKFAARIHDLTGAATGLSTDPERYTSVALNGKVNEYGATKITAELLPFDYLNQSKIGIQFQNIDTNSLSPYAAKFAGREIKSGRLSLDLNYKVVESKLEGINNILLESLVLGEKVESPDAIDLQLDMAISLLEDKDGKIDINLPVSGDLNNPQFEIGAIVQKAIGNLIGGIVSAPFKFIGATFGTDGEELKAIKFEPGSAEITPPEAEKAVTLSQALIQRPALTLTVFGAYDAKLDRAALAKQTLAASVSQLTSRGAAPINYSDPELQAVLDDLASQRLDKEVVSRLKKKLEGDLAGTNDGGAVKKAYYGELFDQLADQTAATIEATTLEDLARNRANAVLGQIGEDAPTVRDRVTIGDDINSVESDKGLIYVKLEAGTIR